MSKFSLYVNQVNSHRYILISEIGEPCENDLRFVISSAESSEKTEDLQIGSRVIKGVHEISSGERSEVYEVLFEGYIAYSVLNESYIVANDYEEFEGSKIRIYSRSFFLDYMAKQSFAKDDYPGPLTHYGFVSLNHILHVIATDPPMIKQLKVGA